MDPLLIVEWIGTACSLVGALLNARNRIEGFYVWTVGNVFWIILALSREMYGLLTMTLVFTVINFIGIYSWRRRVNEVQEETSRD
jgi:nicotinamide riboside transporter PnuC